MACPSVVMSSWTLGLLHLVVISLSRSVLFWSPTCTAAGILTPGFRPPAVPLVVIDPYISVWSESDNLYDDVTKHWSGPSVTLSGMILIDDKPYRFMSNAEELAEDSMKQVNLEVYPTQTIYTFEQDGIQLVLTFSTPSFTTPGQPPYLPMTVITYDITTIDGKNHEVKLYYDNTAEGTVDDVEELVQWNRVSDVSGTATMRIGSYEQKVLSEGTDRIDWGFWYVSVELEKELSTAIANSSGARAAFISGKDLPPDLVNQPQACSDNWPVLAVTWDLGVVQVNQAVSKHLTIIYDQIYSIKYYGTRMEPYWKHVYDGSIHSLLAANTYNDIKKMCDSVDNNITSQLYDAGGSNYTTIASLAWRQAVGGTITVWNRITQEAWMFMKEISSDGDVSTVDILYPASPLFVWWDYHSIELLLKPILEYALNNTFLYGLYTPYDLAWAPHHLGHWPVCDIDASKQEQMPVEESGNMILMIAGSVYASPNKDIGWLKPYWEVLTVWGDFIVASLPDPGDQLCTDDFEGKTAHNINLAAKGMVALGALSYLLELDGQKTLAKHYNEMSEDFVAYWLQHAKGVHDDHFHLQYNLPNTTWSVKYNLLYQKILELDVFPESVFDIELSYYMTKLHKYGIPLDSRADFTKTDWLMWVAALGNSEQFKMIVDAVYKFANETPDRVPFTDWYYTSFGLRKGFMARPVIGGLYAKMLVG